MSGNNISTQIVEYKFKNTSKLIRRNKNSINTLIIEFMLNSISSMNSTIIELVGASFCPVTCFYRIRGKGLRRTRKTKESQRKAEAAEKIQGKACVCGVYSY